MNTIHHKSHYKVKNVVVFSFHLVFVSGRGSELLSVAVSLNFTRLCGVRELPS